LTKISIATNIHKHEHFFHIRVNNIFSKANRTTSCWLAFILSILTSTALAGPPLSTGDTGILDPGGLEIIVATTGDKRDAGDSYELPGVEVSLGLTKNTQTGLVFSRAVVDLNNASRKSDLGPMSFEYAWRFLNGENLTMVVAPSYMFPLNGSSQDRQITDAVRALGVPLIATYATDNWFLTGEMSYTITSSGPNGIGYGTSTGYNISEKLTALAELNGGESDGGSENDQEILWRIGATYLLTEQLTLLLSFGGDFDSDVLAADKLDQDFYLGIQFNIN
jgi:hypothetical protein